MICDVSSERMIITVVRMTLLPQGHARTRA